MNDTHHTMEHNHSMEGMGEMDHSSVQMGGMDHHAMMVQDFKRRFWVSLAVMIPIMILSPMIQMFLGVDWRFPGDSYVLLVLSTFLFFYGGWPFLKGAKDELKRRSPAMMTLIALAIIVAYVYSAATVFGVQGSDFFWELASLIVIMLLGHWIEMRSVMGASKALEELARLMPENAHMIMDNGETMDMPVSSLKTGQTVLVKPGEKIPIDGVVYEGGSEVNEAMITGEAVPVEKGKGDEVIGGSVNGDGILKFKVSHVGDETFLSQVIRLVRDAQASKSNTQRLADRAAKWLFYIALVTGIITFVSWMAIEGNLNFAVTRAVTVIIICCPHALGLAMPLVTSVSTSLAAKNGLLIRNRAAFENARNLDTVVFDKTGTLTEGSFGVTDIQADCVSQDELLAIAASVEANSEHPIARGIVEAGKGRKLAALRVTDYQNLTGEGLRASVDGRPVKIVSPGYLKREGIAFDEKTYSHLAKEGKTVVFILRGSKLLGFIALSDVVRPTAKEAVDELKQMGVTSIMLTGDNQRAADYAARQLDISKVFAEVLPGDKASKIDALHRDGRRVAMTGDGVNDAPSLAKADLGIAIGAGTSVAIETADVILVKSNPLDVVSILRLSRATFKKMVQNLIWATAYNVVALPLAAGVLYYQGVVISPAAGAVLMSLSTIIVAINARLLKLPEK
ncbi:Copper-exporting P-type ATPase B [Eubacterium callanderi]|uniref:copper-translocating P-type ATPase n=1 Tax=Eubacterium callanderi TaxID=53442 RepID=UPI0029FEEFBB|nr:copper-translocating P-type ATPase [Eubacterium callanderi]WPK70009.1 Copper-exporting P-type ATPase B [Eubacterium callanderi]WPK74307.1 Copper-exporting P-type ATPase B [Eubacterium callanderi]